MSCKATQNHCIDDHDTQTSFQAEIVGHNGRIGSFLLNAGNGSFLPTSNRPGTQQVAPIGSCTHVNTPILVAVPSMEILPVVHSTPMNRRKDLVIIANCLPSRLPKDMTYSVLHFGILKQGQLPVTSDVSPPTVVFGPHANFLSHLLEKYEVKTKIASTFEELEKFALLKLLWVSFMWLLCHDVECKQGFDDEYGIENVRLTVTEVHDTKQELLRALVLEAIPVMKRLKSGGQNDVGYDVNNIMEYLESYSKSMPNVIPSKDLAIAEFQGRNGILLAYGNQPLHSELVHRVIGCNP